MSKIALSPDAAGTGTFTLASPNGNTNRTITLPDGDVTLGAATPSITDNGNATAITIDSSENVGIGTTAPSQKLHITQTASGATYPILLHNRTNGNSSVGIQFIATGSDLSDGQFASIEAIGDTAGNTKHDLAFKTVANGGTPTEAMRIDSSGNLLVGTTNKNIRDSSSDEGMVYRNGDSLDINRSGAPPLLVNRLSSDGDIQLFRKGGSTVGSIGNFGTTVFYLAGISNGLKIVAPAAGVDAFGPSTTNGGNRDNTMDIGWSSNRFDDIFATNGTIQTSDRNEKQDIEVLTAAETAVAVACKGLLRKFRWIDAVEEKGDDARIHFGIIAQDLQDAFTAEGLDAGRYAMFISSTWWETQTDVPAVVAVDEVLDEDGNVVTEAVEAKDAYTRTDTFDTLAEAPEGATERTRLGVRYPELLAFIIGAM